MPSTMRLIARQTLSVDTASVTFSNIPQTYTDLRLVVSARTNRANNGDSMYLQFNGDTTSANYSNRILYGTGSSAVTITSATAILLTQGACGSSDTANTFGSSEAYIPNYTGSTTKSVSHQGNSETNAATSYMSVDAGLWSGIAPITSMLLRPGNGTAFRSGSTFFLYGVTSAAGSIPGTFGVDATGGDVTISGGYKYHVFRSSGVLTVAQPGWVEALVVAGGGGGAEWGGGGGAGGFSVASLIVPPGPVPVVVGAGGFGAVGYGTRPGSGSESSFGTRNMTGGGHAGFAGTQAAGAGGSGGGAALNGGSAGAGVAGQGNSGGSTSTTGAGGGGGAGAAGSNAVGTTSGAGGAGSSAASAWGAAVNAGQLSGGSYFFAGGGGGSGSTQDGYTRGLGGVGGGGDGQNGATAGTAGTANTGGGGGGGGRQSNITYAGGNGGSGIVIVRYPVS